MDKQKIRVLLIDDSEKDRLIIERYLRMVESWDLSLFTAATAEEGRKLLGEQEIDVILLDQILRQKSGIQVLKELRASGISLPVIMITGKKDETLPTKLLHAGGDNYLAKDNLSADTIQPAVEFVLDEYKTRQDQKREQEELLRLAKQDDLTNLLSRRYLMAQLRESIDRVAEEDPGLYLFLLDIDNFKRINDRCGHVVGDEILAEIGNTLLNYQSSEGAVGRYGGDEFCLFRENLNRKQAIVIAQRLSRDCFQTMQDVLGEEQRKALSISCTLGLAPYLPGQNRKLFVERVDQALRKAKQSGKNCIGVMGEFETVSEKDRTVEMISPPEKVKGVQERKYSRERVDDMTAVINYEDKEVEAQVLDISAEGLKLRSEKRIPEGADISVRLNKQIEIIDNSLSLEGKVKWTRTDLGFQIEENNSD